MASTPGTPLSRRAVLLGAAGTLALAACGSNGSKSGSSQLPTKSLTPTDDTTPVAAGSTLIPIFGTDPAYQYLVSGSPQRLAFGIDGPEGEHLTDVPGSLSFQLSKDGQAMGNP